MILTALHILVREDLHDIVHKHVTETTLISHGLYTWGQSSVVHGLKAYTKKKARMAEFFRILFHISIIYSSGHDVNCTHNNRN